MALGNALVVFDVSRDSIVEGEILKVLPFQMEFGAEEADFINGL